VFTKNRERLLEAEVAHKFLAELLNHREARGLLSDEHFSVDGTQVAAWASMKSFRAKDGSDEPPSGGSFEPKRILLTVRAPGDLLRFRAAAGSPAPVGDLPLPLLGKLDSPIIRQRAPTGSKP
jgi:hypothetical protein